MLHIDCKLLKESNMSITYISTHISSRRENGKLSPKLMYA